MIKLLAFDNEMRFIIIMKKNNNETPHRSLVYEYIIHIHFERHSDRDRVTTDHGMIVHYIANTDNTINANAMKGDTTMWLAALAEPVDDNDTN